MKLLTLMKKTIGYVKRNPFSFLSLKNFKKFFTMFLSKTENIGFYNPIIKKEYQMYLKNKKINHYNIDNKILISIILNVYDTNNLDNTIKSIINQSYDNYEVFAIGDDIEYDNKKIKIIPLSSDRVDINNQVIKMCKGKYITFINSSDELESNSLETIVDNLNKSNADILYSDEDFIDEKGNYYNPFFKPDWSSHTIFSFNYISNMLVIKKSIMLPFAKEYENIMLYDLIMKLTDKERNIVHVSDILYHTKYINNDFQNTKKMLDETLKRRKIDGYVEFDSNNQIFNLKYNLKKEPKVSIIIPTKDHADLLENCINSIYNKTLYKNYEIVLVDNRSVEEKTFNLIKKYSKNDNFRVVNADMEFNYSKINNLAVKTCKSEYVLLLNNDTLIKSPNWINEMVSYASNKDVGVVGVKLLYDDNTIQHDGVLVGGGEGAVACHEFVGYNGNYHNFVNINRDVSAVTAACMLVSKEIYDSVGGLDEKLAVAFNDIDFSLKVLNKGYSNILLNSISIYHLESKSRGLDIDGEKKKRFDREVYYMKEKWNLSHDIFYNNKLSKIKPFMIDIK